MFSKKQKKTSRNIAELLQSSVTNKGPGGILSKLFRKILIETNIIFTINNLIENYEKNSNKDKSQIQTQVCAEDLTWKSFVDSIVNLLNVRSFSISIKLVHNVKDKDGNWKTTVHEVDAKPNNSIDHIEPAKDTNEPNNNTGSKIKKTTERNDSGEPLNYTDVITKRGKSSKVEI